MMSALVITAIVIWGVPLACLALGGVIAAVSPRARDYLRDQLISG